MKAMIIQATALTVLILTQFQNCSPIGKTANADNKSTVNINSAPTLKIESPAAAGSMVQVKGGATAHFPAQGGKLPYTYTVSGCSSFIDSFGHLQASNNWETCEIVVKDADGEMARLSVSIIPPGVEDFIGSKWTPFCGGQTYSLIPIAGLQYLGITYSVTGCDSYVDADFNFVAGTPGTCTVKLTYPNDYLFQFDFEVAGKCNAPVNVISKVMEQYQCISNNFKIPALGGPLPYSYSVSGCSATIDASTGAVSIHERGECSITMTDAAGQSSNFSFGFAECVATN